MGEYDWLRTRFRTGIASLALLITLISGCGPVYQTDYKFTPPKQEYGRSCIYQCDNSKYQCRQIEDMRVQRCEADARWERERCERELYWKKGRDAKWHECWSDSCSADYDSCEAQYRSCYQSCGGSIDATTRCVANCEKIPPAAAQPSRSTKGTPKAKSKPKKPESVY